MKSPMADRKFTTPMAMPFVSVGRMIEHGGSEASVHNQMINIF
jgi:hypothetical protein